MTPPSVRFLGRRVYLGAVVVLVSAMAQGVTAKRASSLRELCGVSVRTLRRWRKWWRERFVRSRLWRELRGRFVPPVLECSVPVSMLERLEGNEPSERALRMLELLLPLTGGANCVVEL